MFPFHISVFPLHFPVQSCPLLLEKKKKKDPVYGFRRSQDICLKGNGLTPRLSCRQLHFSSLIVP